MESLGCAKKLPGLDVQEVVDTDYIESGASFVMYGIISLENPLPQTHDLHSGAPGQDEDPRQPMQCNREM